MEYPRGVRLWRTCQADRCGTNQACQHRGAPFAYESNDLKPIKFLRAKRMAIGDGRAELSTCWNVESPQILRPPAGLA
jgi:hypothetical protein